MFSTHMKPVSATYTLFPSLSRRGDHTHNPMTFGITTITHPETPLLAGRPIVKANSPLKSYIPHEYLDTYTMEHINQCTYNIIHT